MGLDGRRAFLRYVKVGQFGALSNRLVGPLGPGLNVVHGPNESGKTTLAAFVEGVLFGWKEGRGGQGAYEPPSGVRSGSLLFAAREGAPERADAASSGAVGPAAAAAGARALEGSAALDAGVPAEAELSRTGDGGLQGDLALVADVDLGTFRTMFSLNGDELRRLRQGTAVTARLLTAGSGTPASPAQALAAIQGRLDALASRVEGDEGSLPALAAEREEAKRAVEAATAQVEQHRAGHRELRELEAEREALAERLDGALRSAEHVQAARDGLERLGAEEREAVAELAAARAEEEQARRDGEGRQAEIGRRLATLSVVEDASVRERLDALAAREEKQAHAVDTARANHDGSKAAHEALSEALAADDAVARARRQRTAKVGVATVLTAVFLVAGVPVFMYGRSLPSLSYMILGGGLVLVALMLAAATLGMLLRPGRHDGSLEQRLQDAQWVLLQDEKKLAACEDGLSQVRAAIAEELEAMGLGAARGSVRQARVLLDEAKAVRGQMALDAQRQQAAALRASALQQRLAAIAAERAELAERAGVAPDASLADLDRALGRRERDLKALRDAASAVGRRIDELSQGLAEAERSCDLDRCKMRYEQLACRLKDAEVDFARLVLAKSMLEAAIASWQSKSQPEVYQQASRLMALMTGGRWSQVRMADGGTLEVVDDARTAREVRQLSLGTCQQLYLALRVALLICADSVGQAVPVLADDIFANFDADRRRGAALVLAELARTRQVVVLTCHEEVVAALQAAEPQATVLGL